MGYAARHVLSEHRIAALVLPPVAGYTAWYDASQIAQADNTALASWLDLSGNGWTMSQATPADQPTYYSSTAGKTINGKPAVWFNGTATVLSTAAPIIASNTACTFIHVAQVPVATNADYAFVNGDGTHGWTGLIYDDSAGGMGFLVSGVAWSSSIAAVPTIGIPHAYSLSWNGVSGSTVTATIDSASYTTTGPGTANSPAGTSASIGGGSGGARFHNGAICEVLVYPSILTGPQISAIYSYLKTKWGTP